MPKTSHLVAVTIALLAGLAVLPITATPAAAAPACTWHGCDGRDPHSTHCDVGASTLAEFTSEPDGNMRVELRYSAACHAAWARSTVGASGMPPHPYLVLNAYTSSTGGSPSAEYWVRMTDFATNNLPPSGTVFWGPMNSFSDWVQACIKNISEVGPCTGRH